MIDGKKIKSVIQKKEKLDFIYIGTARAASSWIYECLKEHPEICVPSKKETSPFTKGGKEINEKLFTNLRSCDNNQVKGTFVPGFFMKKKNVYLLKRHFPHIKIIACLRNPVERAYSHYWLDKSVGRIEDNFREALQENKKYVDLGKYYTNLRPYLDNFPKENVLTLIYEDIKSNPFEFIKEVYNFLGVDNTFSSEFTSRKINVATKKGVRLVLLNKTVLILLKFGKLFKKNKIGFFLIKLFKLIKLNSLINFINKKNIKRQLDRKPGSDQIPLIKKEDKNYLENFYRDEVKKLEKLINKNLFFWWVSLMIFLF